MSADDSGVRGRQSDETDYTHMLAVAQQRKPPRVGDEIIVPGTVRTVEMLSRPGHYRITLDVILDPTPPTPCTKCEGGESRCLYYACAERQDDRHSRWWCEFGTCSRAHAVLHYGEEAI